MHLPHRWVWNDKWYSFTEALTEDQNILLIVDESTYDPDSTWGNPKTALGDFYPKPGSNRYWFINQNDFE
jgi:hypothetical protein